MDKDEDAINEDELFKGICFSKEPPFVGSARDWLEFIDVANSCIQRVKSSSGLREIVLETWLLIDFCVRDLLLAAFDLKRFNHEEFDLRYEFLPRSFRECIALLRKTYKAHLSLAEITIPSEQDISPIAISVPFMLHCYQHDKELLERLENARQAYIAKRYPQHGGITLLGIDYTQHTCISKGWLMLIQQLPDAWFERVEKLNAARNLAAHAHEQDKIAMKLGFTGSRTVDHTRAECLKIIEELVGVIPKPATSAK